MANGKFHGVIAPTTPTGCIISICVNNVESKDGDLIIKYSVTWNGSYREVFSNIKSYTFVIFVFHHENEINQDGYASFTGSDRTSDLKNVEIFHLL